MKAYLLLFITDLDYDGTTLTFVGAYTTQKEAREVAEKNLKDNGWKPKGKKGWLKEYNSRGYEDDKDVEVDTLYISSSWREYYEIYPLHIQGKFDEEYQTD